MATSAGLIFLAATKQCQRQRPRDGQGRTRGRHHKAANGDAEPSAYHHGLLPPDLFCAFTTFSLAIERLGLEKQPLLVVLSSYIHLYVSILHLILIDFVLES